jgi:hypothetical protein
MLLLQLLDISSNGISGSLEAFFPSEPLGLQTDHLGQLVLFNASYNRISGSLPPILGISDSRMLRNLVAAHQMQFV